MSRARELAKVGGKNQQVIAGLSSHVGVSTFLNNVHMFANLDVGGNVTVTGTTTFNGGTLTLGDANTDNIVFGGEVDSNIIPDDDGSYDLGSSTKEWKDIFIDGTAHIDTLDVDENAGIIGNLTLTGNADFNGDLDVDGTTNLDVVDIDGAVDMASNLVIAGNIDANGNLDVDGTTDLDTTNVVGTLTVTGDIAADNVTVNGNTVSTSSGGLTLDSSGGTVTVSDNLTVSGTATFNTALANSNLANSTVSYGGVSLALGGSDGTPAFDLSDATNYPTSSLSGTITNAQLAGSIANAKLTNSSVSYGGVSLSLGGTDATPAFDLQDATGYPTSSLVGTITNAQLAGSIASAKLANSGVTAGTVGSSTAIPIITVNAQGQITSTSTTAIDSTTIENGTASVAVAEDGPITSTGNHDFTAGIDVTGNSTFANNVTITGSVDANGGASIDNVQVGVTNDNEIDTSTGNLVIDSAGGTVTVDDNLTVSGNLTVNGTTTTINSTTVAIDDKNFQVATGAADDAAADGAGLTVDSGDGDKTWNFEATGDNWGASENINLASGKVYKINNSQVLSATALSSNVTVPGSTVDIDGTTDIGAAIVDADEILIDDGGGGTNRRSDMSRVKAYIYGALSSDLTASSAGAVTLANSGVSAGTVGSSTAIPILTIDSKGRVTNTSTTAIDQTTIAVLDTSVAVTDTGSNGKITGKADNTTVYEATSGTFAVTGNITVSGTVDGRDVASDGSKLDGIESAATADQTASEILTLIKTVDGAGSGLDADTLDGISSASFLRSDTSDTFTGTLTMAGSIIPSADGTQNLGASGTRWANIYSSDIDLSNEAKGGNSIDGSWGSYLIEEGEEHLYLTNRRSGKKFKFMLEEV